MDLRRLLILLLISMPTLCTGQTRTTSNWSLDDFIHRPIWFEYGEDVRLNWYDIVVHEDLSEDTILFAFAHFNRTDRRLRFVYMKNEKRVLNKRYDRIYEFDEQDQPVHILSDGHRFVNTYRTDEYGRVIEENGRTIHYDLEGRISLVLTDTAHYSIYKNNGSVRFEYVGDTLVQELHSHYHGPALIETSSILYLKQGDTVKELIHSPDTGSRAGQWIRWTETEFLSQYFDETGRVWGKVFIELEVGTPLDRSRRKRKK